MKRYFLSVCAALFALMVLCSVTTRAADNVYAILYNDGTLVFQHGNTPESGKTVKKTYEVDLNAVYNWDSDKQIATTPWYNERESVCVVNFADKISPKDTSFWFIGCSNLKCVNNIRNLDTANVTSMRAMFSGCGKLTELDVSRFNTANVLNMSAMFHSCSGLTTLDVSQFDTAKVMNISSMFEGCSGLTMLDVSRFHTANVWNMSFMFHKCSGLTALDVSHFDTANVTNMRAMFSGCGKLTALDVSHFNTAKVTTMYYMFYGCSGLATLNVSHFDTANVTDIQGMFYNCNELTALDVSHFDTANVTNMRAMFSVCSKLTALDVSHFNTAKVTNMSAMFHSCGGLTTLDVSHFDTANVTTMYYMFPNCTGLTALDLSHFHTANVTNMQGIFDGCSNLKTIYSSEKFTTASVTDSSDMFNGCTSLIGGNGTKYDSNHTDKEYARIDTASAPGYFTSKTQPQPEPNPETYVITAYAGEGGTVTPAGDTRISAGGSQKYVMTPNPGYRVQSVRIDGVEVGALSEYVFQNIVTGHNLVVSFEHLPHYAITAAVSSGDQLSVTLENSGAVTVTVWYSDRNGQFLSADMQTVSANAGTVTFPLPFAYKARVTLLDSVYAPLCDPVAVR